MPGLVPGIPITGATRRQVNRDCRDKPGNDGAQRRTRCMALAVHRVGNSRNMRA